MWTTNNFQLLVLLVVGVPVISHLLYILNTKKNKFGSFREIDMITYECNVTKILSILDS